jgi:hypothetical protein
LAKAETKSELTAQIDKLEQMLSNREEQESYHRREGDSLRRLIVDLVKDERTLKLRFSWLEEAASEVVTACKEHQPGAIERLADELGIELKQEQ